MKPGRKRAAAALAAGALLLAGCDGGSEASDSGDGGGESSDATSAVASALDERLTDGATFSLIVDGDTSSIVQNMDGNAVPAEFMDTLLDGGISGAVHPEDGFRINFLEHISILGKQEEFYLRADVQGLIDFVIEVDPSAAQGAPSIDDLRGMLSFAGLPPEVEELALALLDGEWVGVTGVDSEAVTEFMETVDPSGQAAADTAEMQGIQDAIKEALEAEDMLDGEAFADRYLEVSGDGPEYDVIINVQELLAAMTNITEQVGEATGEDVTEDLADLEQAAADAPETLGGFTITVEDGAATAVSFDVGEIGQQMADHTGEEVPTDAPAPGELSLVVELDDLGDALDTPSGAATIDLSELLSVMDEFAPQQQQDSGATTDS